MSGALQPRGIAGRQPVAVVGFATMREALRRCAAGEFDPTPLPIARVPMAELGAGLRAGAERRTGFFMALVLVRR